MYVCICHSITDKDIENCVKEGAQNLQDLQALTGCATGCGSCAGFAQELIEEHQKRIVSSFLTLHPESQKATSSI